MDHSQSAEGAPPRPANRMFLLLVLLCSVSALALVVYFGLTWVGADLPHRQVLAPILISIIISVIPMVVCLVQSTSRLRQLERLRSLRDSPVFETTYCRLALNNLASLVSPTLSSDFLVPIIAFAAVTSLSSFIVMAGFFVPDIFHLPSAIMGGMMVVDGDTASGALVAYQKGTFVVCCMAFVGSYVYTLTRLLERVGNNDLYPISLHYYSAHIVIACLIAAVLRHCADAFGVGRNNGLLLLLGFATGFAPDLIIVTMLRRAFQALKVFGSKDDPKSQYRPKALPLLMLDDLTKDKVDRLMELGIDSAHALARQNPFMIWPKLPYDLGLLVDWIAEAQLYTLLRAEYLLAARHRLIVNIFDLELRLRDSDAAGATAKAIGIQEHEVPCLLAQLQADITFTRLREVRDAMVVKPPIAKATKQKDFFAQTVDA